MNYPPFPTQNRIFEWTDSSEVSKLYEVNENAIQQWLVADSRWDQYCTEDDFPGIVRSIVGEYRQYIDQMSQQ